ncbi:Mediator of RNA polymerase II transcription subunit 13-like [Irineochytrium annulatum]|nr:Mediator of RNA polymerase II transcription subunit 13-like [Irineochytrium annulatum]
MDSSAVPSPAASANYASPGYAPATPPGGVRKVGLLKRDPSAIVATGIAAAPAGASHPLAVHQSLAPAIMPLQQQPTPVTVTATPTPGFVGGAGDDDEENDSGDPMAVDDIAGSSGGDGDDAVRECRELWVFEVEGWDDEDPSGAGGGVDSPAAGAANGAGAGRDEAAEEALSPLELLERGEFSGETAYFVDGADGTPANVEAALFMGAMSNLLERTLAANGVMRIGQRFAILNGSWEQGLERESMPVPRTPLVCLTPHIFFIGSNLIAQTKLTRSKLRPIRKADLGSAKKVLVVLSPLGITAEVLPNVPSKLADSVDEWIRIHPHLGHFLRQPMGGDLPAFLTVSIENGRCCTEWPTHLMLKQIGADEDVGLIRELRAGYFGHLDRDLAFGGEMRAIDFWDYSDPIHRVIEETIKEMGSCDYMIEVGIRMAEERKANEAKEKENVDGGRVKVGARLRATELKLPPANPEIQPLSSLPAPPQLTRSATITTSAMPPKIKQSMSMNSTASAPASMFAPSSGSGATGARNGASMGRPSSSSSSSAPVPAEDLTLDDVGDGDFDFFGPDSTPPNHASSPAFSMAAPSPFAIPSTPAAFHNQSRTHVAASPAPYTPGAPVAGGAPSPAGVPPPASPAVKRVASTLAEEHGADDSMVAWVTTPGSIGVIPGREPFEVRVRQVENTSFLGPEEDEDEDVGLPREWSPLEIEFGLVWGAEGKERYGPGGKYSYEPVVNRGVKRAFRSKGRMLIARKRIKLAREDELAGAPHVVLVTNGDIKMKEEDGGGSESGSNSGDDSESEVEGPVVPVKKEVGAPTPLPSTEPEVTSISGLLLSVNLMTASAWKRRRRRNSLGHIDPNFELESLLKTEPLETFPSPISPKKTTATETFEEEVVEEGEVMNSSPIKTAHPTLPPKPTFLTSRPPSPEPVEPFESLLNEAKSKSLLDTVLPGWKADDEAVSLTARIVSEDVTIGRTFCWWQNEITTGGDISTSNFLSVAGKRVHPCSELSSLLRLGKAITDSFVPFLKPAIKRDQPKGPLTLQQYYDIQEPDRSYAKYKFTRKKKRVTADNPNLELLATPDLVILHNSTTLRLNPAAVRFWDKLRLTPFGRRKRCRLLVISPQAALSQDLLEGVRGWMSDMVATWDVCGFGELDGWSGADDTNGIRIVNGLMQVPLQPWNKNETRDERRFRSYKIALDRLDKEIALFSPAYVLTKPATTSAGTLGPGLALYRPLNSPMVKVIEPERMLIVSYSVGKEWVGISAADPTGELIEVRSVRACSHAKDRKVGDVLRDIWRFVKEVIGVGGLSWRVVIGKLGHVGVQEAKAWDITFHHHFDSRCHVYSNKPWGSLPISDTIASVSLLSLSLDSPLSVIDPKVAHGLSGGGAAAIAMKATTTESSGDCMTAEEVPIVANRGGAMSSGFASEYKCGEDETILHDGPASFAVIVTQHRSPVTLASDLGSARWLNGGMMVESSCGGPIPAKEGEASFRMNLSLAYNLDEGDEWHDPLMVYDDTKAEAVDPAPPVVPLAVGWIIDMPRREQPPPIPPPPSHGNFPASGSVSSTMHGHSSQAHSQQLNHQRHMQVQGYVNGQQKMQKEGHPGYMPLPPAASATPGLNSMATEIALLLHRQNPRIVELGGSVYSGWNFINVANGAGGPLAGTVVTGNTSASAAPLGQHVTILRDVTRCLHAQRFLHLTPGSGVAVLRGGVATGYSLGGASVGEGLPWTFRAAEEAMMTMDCSRL